MRDTRRPLARSTTSDFNAATSGRLTRQNAVVSGLHDGMLAQGAPALRARSPGRIVVYHQTAARHGYQIDQRGALITPLPLYHPFE